MMGTTKRALRRAVAGGASAAIAVAGLTLGLAAPAQAAPVTVSGTLTDAAGNALDGYVYANVLMPDGTYGFGPGQEVVDGIIALPVEPGTYKFQFFDEGNNFVGEFYNDKPTIEAADPVVVAGPVTLAPVALAARPAFTGQVLSPSGRPLENASVRLLNSASGTEANYALTKPDGTFRVAASAAGDYKIQVVKSGFATEFYNNKPTLAAADPVALGAVGDVALAPISLQKGTPVTGQVTNAAGVGLERVSVSLIPTSPNGNQFFDSTDAGGTLFFEGVTPGTYKLRFSDPLNEYLPEFWSDKADLATADVLTVGLDPVANVNAVLAPDPANVAPDPAKIDLSGVVVDSSGRPVVGAQVEVWDTPADGERRDQVTGTRTNRSGVYTFTTLDGGYTSENAFKLYAYDAFQVEKGAYARIPRWFGGAQSYAGANEVGVPTNGANISLPLTGGISGTITSEANLPVSGVSVAFFDAKGNPGSQFGGTSAEENGTYASTSLLPGKYKVLFSDSDLYSDGIYDHAPEWYDDATFDAAKTITVKSGATVTGINAALSQELKALRRPAINGKPYLDGKLRAYPGVWSLESSTTFIYEWLIGDTVVGTGPTYKVTGAAKNKRVTLRVLAENGPLNGTALVSTQVIKKKPKVTVSVKGNKALITVSGKKIKPKKIKGKIVVKKIVKTDDYGAPVYKLIGKGKLANGRATVTLKKLSKGKNKLVFFITLKGGKLGDATIAKTIKIKH